MIIAIDASRAVKKQRTGTENYSRDLIFELAKIDKKNQYILYVGPEYAGDFNNLAKNFSVTIIPNRIYWTKIGLSREMLKHRPDTLFVPSHILPLIGGKKNVITIHDLAWKYFPEVYSKKELRLQDQVIKQTLKKKADIIVYSKSTANDLKKFYKINKKKIHFVPMGFEVCHCETKDRGNLSEKIASLTLAMTKLPYILFVGRLELKKNILNLIKAYNLLRSERKIRHKLVLVGKSGSGYEEIRNEIKSSKYKNDIIETGYISDHERNWLYKNAELFAFPSFYEGFGFPILEAFAAGLPVVTSNISSMPEVAGSGAILVDPKKPFEIAAAMSQIINKPELREKLIKAGKTELSKYSWQTCARETLKVLERNAK